MSLAGLSGDLAKLSLRLAKKKVPTLITIQIHAISKISSFPDFTSTYSNSVRLVHITLRQIMPANSHWRLFTEKK
jgi:hypothetical protein